MTEIPVPLDVVRLTDETNQTITPGIGDTLTLTIEGKVTRVDVGQVWVQPETVNGQSVPVAPELPTAQGIETEMAGLTGEEY